MHCCNTLKNDSVKGRLAPCWPYSRTAEQRIERDPVAGLVAPRPYRNLTQNGRAWLKARRYWIAYTTKVPAVIVGVFFETADIPRRF